jgi:hypothetical protein
MDLKRRLDIIRKVKRTVERELQIKLDSYGIVVKKMYDHPQPQGFDFWCRHPEKLLADSRKARELKFDDPATKSGAFMGSQSPGRSFREKGTGASVHLTIALNRRCNVHIDREGLVGHDGCYNLSAMIRHGAVDLLPHLINVPGGPIGDDGYWGPSLSAGKGLAGGDTINFGIGGRF